MCDENKQNPTIFTMADDAIYDVRLGHRVESRRSFVEYQDLRLRPVQRSRKNDTLFLTSR